MGSVRAVRLQRVQAALAAGLAPAADDLAWLLAIEPESVPPQSGEADAALRETRTLIIEFSQVFRLTAAKVRRCIYDYETTAWSRERLNHECLPERAGRKEEYCWRILRAYGRAPSEKVIRRILDGKDLDKSRGKAPKAPE
jgi:hypothetical protein